MKYIITLLAALTMATTVQASDSKEDTCAKVADLGLATFKAMKEGANEDQILDMLRERQIYSGPLAWGAQEGMKFPADSPEWMVRGDLVVMCKKRTDI